MPFSFRDRRVDALIQLLRQHPEGVTLVEIAGVMRPIPARRALQRWLARLAFVDLLTLRGRGSSTRYFAGRARGPLPVKKRTPKPPVVPAPAPKPAPPPPPKPEPDDSQLPPEYRELFDWVAPRVIRMGYTDEVAMSELGRAAIQAWKADTDTMNAFILAGIAEFDVLHREPSLRKYGLRREQWDYWRDRWCRARDLPADEP